jgi:outer membrane protein, heavy metal efflux system
MNRSFVAALLAAGCLTGRTRTEWDEAVRLAAPEPPKRDLAADEDQLAHETRLEIVLRIAQARNPDVGEARERTRAALERVPAASRLPDLEFMYAQWAVPLASPFALDQAQMLMWGLRQSIPAPGSLDARSRVALADAETIRDTEHVRQIDIAAQVRRAYSDYYRAFTEFQVHQEHVKLTSAVVDLARANFRVGRTTQQDVLRTIVELSRIHTELANVEQEVASSRALLNALMARPIDAPLGPPVELSAPEGELRAADLERRLLEHRPELSQAARAVTRSRAALDRARSEAHWPAFMIGADYWYMPTAPDVQNAWSASLSITLPWLNPRHREEVREAEHTVAADQRALESARNAALYQLRDALARHQAAQRTFAVIDKDLLPQARQSFEAAQSAFASGKADGLSVLDALRSYLQVRLDRTRALARLQSTLADVDRAVGSEGSDR